MYTVWFKSHDGGSDLIFISDVLSGTFAARIAANLEEEGFVFKAWVEAS